MRVARPSFICLQCRLARPRTARSLFPRLVARLYSDNSSSNGNENVTNQKPQHIQRPTTAPRPNIDIKHIRVNAKLHEQNCLKRNYKIQSTYPARIGELAAQWQTLQKEGRSLRERNNALRRQIANPATIQHEDEAEEGSASNPKQNEISQTGDVASTSRRDVRTMTASELLEEARTLKQAISVIEENEARISTEMEDYALAMPNLTSEETPQGDKPRILNYINEAHPAVAATARSSHRVWHSHVHIGSELGILDFTSAATASGWGWYYLLDEGAQLEQALIAYALATVTRMPGWRQIAPPSIVYSHIAAACGFQPRDQNGETQIYTLSQSETDINRRKPERSLAGTAEIPLAGMRADSYIEAADLPIKRVATSRCYRAEAGARGADTKGLYRVHEFSKVEMFAWTVPTLEETTEIFDELVDAQTEILSSLGLHCRVLEMPSADLGASATRKIDIEAFFPSRAAQGLNGGWGEVTSASICTDYQTRRLATRLRGSVGSDGPKPSVSYPWTVNGTALAVPRVLAAVLENGWDEAASMVRIPECLRPWMDGKDRIETKVRKRALEKGFV
ncbi:hypothetical protein GGR50DRAFT_655800 [Xylaria sp. CBS 124048]|nr:hypothetical protein GGR50DRAFT_655800 [Xylaria sp. CBS 124048]